MVKHPWPLLEVSLSDFCRLATLNINTYLPTLEEPAKQVFEPFLNQRTTETLKTHAEYSRIVPRNENNI